ncbi:MAG: rRNA processing protein RimM [Pseudonocardiales bacterium]|nr:rRNA processing protein RimM [Pseudonocardiales bacterium]
MTTSPTGGDGGPDGPLVAVGRIGKAHGIRGDAFVEPWTDAPDERFAAGARLSTDPAERGPLTVESTRQHSGKLVVHFAGLDDRNAIEALRGTLLLVPAAARPPIEDPDEFYDTDLIGLAVRTVDGRSLGPVTDVLHSPAGSLLAVALTAEDGREVLVPFRTEFVPTVDLAAGIAEIDPPDGLLEL